MRGCPVLCRIRLHRISNSSRRSRIRPVVYRRDESSRSRDPIIDGYRSGGDDYAFEDLFFETVGRRVENLLPVIFDYVMGYASDYGHPPLRPLFFPGMSFFQSYIYFRYYQNGYQQHRRQPFWMTAGIVDADFLLFRNYRVLVGISRLCLNPCSILKSSKLWS